MKESYITSNFRKTAAQRFPAQAERLNAAFDARLEVLRRENAAASKEKRRHLESQIMPGIAAYEILQTVMPKDEALRAVHGYVEQRAWRMKKVLLRLMRIPGLYKKVPGIFSKETPKFFGEAAGFAATEIQTTGGTWHIDMTKCPPITTPASNTAARSCAPASATVTIFLTAVCTRSSTGTEPRRWAAAMTAAIFA